MTELVYISPGNPYCEVDERLSAHSFLTARGLIYHTLIYSWSKQNVDSDAVPDTGFNGSMGLACFDPRTIAHLPTSKEDRQNLIDHNPEILSRIDSFLKKEGKYDSKEGIGYKKYHPLSTFFYLDMSVCTKLESPREDRDLSAHEIRRLDELLNYFNYHQLCVKGTKATHI